MTIDSNRADAEHRSAYLEAAANHSPHADFDPADWQPSVSVASPGDGCTWLGGGEEG